MREDGKDSSRRYGRGGTHISQPRWDDRSTEERPDHHDIGRPEKLEEVGYEVLVVRMESMESQVGGIGVVEEVIKWGDYRSAKGIPNGDRRSVEGRVDEDSDASEE